MTRKEKKENKNNKKRVLHLAKHKANIFKSKSLFSVIMIYYKQNKGLIISFIIIFNFIIFLSSIISLTMSEYQKKFIAEVIGSYIKTEGHEQKTKSIGGVFSNYIYGGIGLAANIIIIAYISSKVLLNELETGSIVFWLSSSVNKNKIIRSKIYFIYSFVIINWLFSFAYSLPILFAANDRDNIKFALVKMFTHLITCLLLATLAIYTSLLLSDSSDWYFILWIFVTIYSVLMFACSLFFSYSKLLNNLSIGNMFSNFLSFEFTEKDKTLEDTTVIYEISSHIKPNWTQFGIAMFLVPSLTVLLNEFEIIRYWNKIEFNS